MGIVPLTPSPDRPIPVRRVHWRNAVRIIPSIFPPISLFERVARPADLDAVLAIESAFNPRLRDAAGDLSLVPRDERVVGPGAGYIMAAFTHLSPEGSRFSSGTYGVFYAAQRESTAIAETRYHRERFMRATKQARCELDMRVLTMTVKASLHDLRGMKRVLPEVYRLDDYTSSQLVGGALRAGGSNGIVYDSVRQDSGRCVAVFRPRVLSHCKEQKHLRYIWDGAKISDVLEIKRLGD
ncbi:MAG TPA: RES family NAD+ phosphorylase [Gemmatimonadaceae bacterium]|nr:RES family NAD+ phosphorylase [Gemmatimonadaceae bacterium]